MIIKLYLIITLSYEKKYYNELDYEIEFILSPLPILAGCQTQRSQGPVAVPLWAVDSVRPGGTIMSSLSVSHFVPEPQPAPTVV